MKIRHDVVNQTLYPKMLPDQMQTVDGGSRCCKEYIGAHAGSFWIGWIVPYSFMLVKHTGWLL